MAEQKKEQTHKTQGKNNEKPKEYNEEKDMKEGTRDSRLLIYFIIGLFAIVALIIFAPKIMSMFTKTDTSGIVPSDKYYFNGFYFQKVGPLWYTEIQRGSELFSLPMHYGPKELTGFLLGNNTTNSIKVFFFDFIPKFIEKDTNLGLAYLTFDPKDNLSNVVLATTEISIKLRQTFGIKLVSACIDNSTGSGCEGREKITCNNTEFPVIYINEIGSGIDKGNSDGGVSVKGNCLTIEGNGVDVLKLTDRVLYVFFGIMN